MHWYGWPMGGWMIFWWIAAAAFIIVSVFWLVSQSRRSVPPRTPSAEEELKRRYALGEIDREQYLRMLEDLRK